MTLGEKISRQRKENNYTQEQLAELLGVSRQSISKWESDLAYPETDKLIRMGRLFGCSMDYLLRDECTEPSGKAAAEPEKTSLVDEAKSFVKKQFRERKSEKLVFGMPLYHVARNAGGFFAVGVNAKGVIAIGMKARGILSLGVLSLGIFSYGLLSLGIASIGVFSLGLLSAGSISAGLISAGAISFGIVSFGAIAVGDFAVGALAIGRYIAVGDHARAMIAVGDTNAIGSVYQSVGGLSTADIPRVKELLDANVPGYLNWAKELIRLFLG